MANGHGGIAGSVVSAGSRRRRPQSCVVGANPHRNVDLGENRHMSAIDDRLKSLGIELPQPAAPVANYVPYVLHGSLLVISGQLALGPDGTIAPEHKGKIGASVSPEVAKAAARVCVINVLAQVKAAVGSLDRIERCVRLGGFMNAAPGFSAIAPVMNGASDLVVEVLGDKGRHARSTIGVAELPLDSVVEVEAMFAVSV